MCLANAGVVLLVNMRVVTIVQIVNGAVDVVNAVCDHPDITAVSFVGSSKVAELVAKRCRALNKRVLALGGAKNHLVRHLVLLPCCLWPLAARCC